MRVVVKSKEIAGISFEWKTFNGKPTGKCHNETVINVNVGNGSSYVYGVEDLREIAQFFTECADDIEGKSKRKPEFNGSLKYCDYKPKQQDNRYPHKCPNCGAPAYVGLGKIDCSAGC
jgi:hypothetical protein